LLLAAFALGGVILATAWPSGTKVVAAGGIADLNPDSPAHNDHGFFIVLLSSGDVVALLDQDPRGYFGPNSQDCQIEWRPDFRFDGKTGWFRDNCTGSTFAVNGFRVFGPSPRSMDRYSVAIRDGEIRVDTGRILTCKQGEFHDLDCD
jgi:hypothetical protein